MYSSRSLKLWSVSIAYLTSFRPMRDHISKKKKSRRVPRRWFSKVKYLVSGT